jgi:(4S)-4-hydroxy-5-phosphonooxypentane-2,3-dione isomerase
MQGFSGGWEGFRNLGPSSSGFPDRGKVDKGAPCWVEIRAEDSMLVVLVDIRVRPALAEAFVAVTRSNAAASRREPGIAQFDLLGDPNDPLHFMLVEVYRTKEAALLHKETEHYRTWRDAVEPMMAEARSSSKWTAIDQGARD